VSDECGKKAQPKTGVGAQKLTTKEMADLIKRRGHQVPKGNPSREELCAVIKEHKLTVTPDVIVKAPVPAPVAAPAPSFEAAKIKNFLASQNVVVVKEAPKLVAVPHLSEKKLWDLYTKKLTNEIYNTLPKDDEYQERRDKASTEAFKRVKNMKARGEPAPAYYAKK